MFLEVRAHLAFEANLIMFRSYFLRVSFPFIDNFWLALVMFLVGEIVDEKVSFLLEDFMYFRLNLFGVKFYLSLSSVISVPLFVGDFAGEDVFCI